MSITWQCRCGKRTFQHQEWCASCGAPRPRPVASPPSQVPSVFDDLKKDATTVETPGLVRIGTYPSEITGLAVAGDCLIVTTADGRVYQMSKRGLGKVREMIAAAIPED